MSTTMRAKLQVGNLQEHVSNGAKYCETLNMHAVAANKYDASGLDEDNTYAKMSPGANLSINIANPALWGKFKHGDKFYVDFKPAETSSLQPHQQRVVDERAENEARLDRLTAFLATPTFEALPEAEQERLVRQSGVMVQLSDVLAERIAAFGA